YRGCRAMSLHDALPIYYARVSSGVRSQAEREYLSERFQAANWLIKSLHQRALTIIKVAAEIVRRQEAFFFRGVQALRPLILREGSEEHTSELQSQSNIV